MVLGWRPQSERDCEGLLGFIRVIRVIRVITGRVIRMIRVIRVINILNIADDMHNTSADHKVFRFTPDLGPSYRWTLTRGWAWAP